PPALTCCPYTTLFRSRGNHTHVFPGTGALFVMQDNGWDHALKVTGDGAGLVGHAGAVLLRKAADQAGLTAGLSAALQRAGKSPRSEEHTSELQSPDHL